MNKSKFRGSYTWKKKRSEILERDKHKCVICNSNDNLCIHHIYSLNDYSELALENTNLVTLCSKCHEKVHNGIYSTVYLTNLINET